MLGSFSIWQLSVFFFKSLIDLKFCHVLCAFSSFTKLSLLRQTTGISSGAWSQDVAALSAQMSDLKAVNLLELMTFSSGALYFAQPLRGGRGGCFCLTDENNV
jgi:hypothetical protein